MKKAINQEQIGQLEEDNNRLPVRYGLDDEIIRTDSPKTSGGHLTKYCRLCSLVLRDQPHRHYKRKHNKVLKEIKQGDKSIYLKRDETPPFPLYSNWQEIIYGPIGTQVIFDVRNGPNGSRWSSKDEREDAEHQAFLDLQYKDGIPVYQNDVFGDQYVAQKYKLRYKDLKMKINPSPKQENIKEEIQPKPELKQIFKISQMVDPKEIGKLKGTIDDLEVRREELQEEEDARKKYKGSQLIVHDIASMYSQAPEQLQSKKDKEIIKQLQNHIVELKEKVIFGPTLESMRAFTGNLGKLAIHIEHKKLMNEVMYLTYDRNLREEDYDKLDKAFEEYIVKLNEARKENTIQKDMIDIQLQLQGEYQDKINRNYEQIAELMEDKTKIQEDLRLEKMKRVKWAENCEEIKIFSQTDVVTARGLTIEEGEKEVYKSDVEEQSNQINRHWIQRTTPGPEYEEAVNEKIRQEGYVQRSDDLDVWDKQVNLIEAEQKQSQLDSCKEHLNIENSNEIEANLKEQNKAKPKLVQAKEKKQKSKSTWKLVKTKHPKGKKPPQKKKDDHKMYDLASYSHSEAWIKQVNKQAKEQLEQLQLELDKRKKQQKTLRLTPIQKCTQSNILGDGQSITQQLIAQSNKPDYNVGFTSENAPEHTPAQPENKPGKPYKKREKKELAKLEQRIYKYLEGSNYKGKP